jgi:hypothetical protein
VENWKRSQIRECAASPERRRRPSLLIENGVAFARNAAALEYRRPKNFGVEFRPAFPGGGRPEDLKAAQVHADARSADRDGGESCSLPVRFVAAALNDKLKEAGRIGAVWSRGRGPKTTGSQLLAITRNASDIPPRSTAHRCKAAVCAGEPFGRRKIAE